MEKNDAELLADGIHDMAARLGVIQEGTSLTGPQCLTLLKDIEGLAASAQTAVAPLVAQVEQSDLASAFQEFVYRVVSQVPFEHASWANERAAELMEEINRLASQGERQPVGWFVQGENTYLYTNVPEKPNFVCINGGDKVISIEARYAQPAQGQRHSVGHVCFKNNYVTDIVSREVVLSGEYELVPRTKSTAKAER